VHQLAQVDAHIVLGHLDVLGSEEGVVAAESVVEQVAGVLLDDPLVEVHDKHDLVEGVRAVADNLIDKVSTSKKKQNQVKNTCIMRL
jgi:hypothetical protein